MVKNEIEHRFLVDPALVLGLKTTGAIEIVQFYLKSHEDITNRVRTSSRGPTLEDEVILCYKVKPKEGEIGRPEIEIPISLDYAKKLDILRDGALITKTRYHVPHVEDGLTWEVDVFGDQWKGLVIAELEVPCEGYVINSLPSWVGTDITRVKGISNKAMATNDEKARAIFRELGVKL